MCLDYRCAIRSIILFACASGALTIGIQAQTTEFDRFIGRDLWKHRPSTEELQRLNQIIGKVPKGQMWEPVPWHVWKTHTAGQTRYVVVLGEGLAVIPGGSSACIQLFDAAGRKINSWSFLTGWRIDLQGAHIDFSRNLLSDLIVFQMTPMIGGPNISKEYFALTNDRLRLVRLENDKDKAVQNDYISPHYEIGMIPADKTVDQWANLLESRDKTDVLSALVFLGGRHICELEDQFAPGPHQSQYAGLFQQLIDSQQVHETIVRLSNSDDDWIRHAALLATRGPRERSVTQPAAWRLRRSR